MGLREWPQWSISIVVMTVSIPTKGTADFRDIRADLEARIKTVEEMIQSEEAKFLEQQEKAAAEHKKKMLAYRQAVTGYRSMLALEESFAEHNLIDSRNKIGPMPEEIKIQMPMARPPLAEFFIAQVKEHGPMTKDELRRAAVNDGYFQPGDTGGRQTHVTLVNIHRGNRIGYTDGKYSALQMEDSLL